MAFVDVESRARFQRSLERIQATLEVVGKSAPGQPWETIGVGLTSLDEALAMATAVSTFVETGVLLEHPRYAGIFIWLSSSPDVVNSIDSY